MESKKFARLVLLFIALGVTSYAFGSIISKIKEELEHTI